VSKYIPDRKVLSAGIAGVLAWGLVLLAPRVGLPLTLDIALPVMVALMGGVAYLVPPSAKDVIKRIDGEIMSIAGLMPAGPPPAARPSAGPATSRPPSS
jgi:hypothetical protein